MRKIIIANRKGGVGKTTTAVHLSMGITKVNHSVLLIDTDGQGNCSYMLGVKPEVGLPELLMEEISPQEAVIEVRENLYLLSGNKRMAKAARLIAREEYDSQYVLKNTLKPYEKKYDFVILDTAPGYDTLAINVFFYGKEVIVPINMEILSTRGFLDLLEELKPITKRSGVKIRFILPTMADGRKGLTKDIIDQLQENFGALVCNPIRYMARMSEIPRKGKTIYEEDQKSRPALDYAELTGRILQNG